jgi:hypothetical protein
MSQADSDALCFYQRCAWHYSQLALEEAMAWWERVGMARLARDLLHVCVANTLRGSVGCIELAAVVRIVAQERNSDRPRLAEHLPHVLQRSRKHTRARAHTPSYHREPANVGPCAFPLQIKQQRDAPVEADTCAHARAHARTNARTRTPIALRGARRSGVVPGSSDEHTT